MLKTQSRRIPWSGKTYLTLILFASVIFRLAAAFYLGDSLSGEQQMRIYDQVSYNALARSLINGQGYTFEQDWYPGFTIAGQVTAHWSFLYPLYLAGIYAVTGYHPLAARFLQAVVAGALSVWLIFRLGRRLFGETVGLIAAALAAVYLYFIYHDAALMTEAFFTVGVLAILNLTLYITGKLSSMVKSSNALAPGATGWLGLGIVLGLTALLRQTILLWVPFLILWIIWAARGSLRIWGLIITLGITALIILPWTIRNYMVYHAFLPLNSNAGYALYSANHPDHGTDFDQDYAAPLPADLQNLGLNEAQWNTELSKRGLQFILDDPQRYLLLSLDRIGIFFNFWFSTESISISNWMRVVSFGLYLPFFIGGLIFSRQHWRSASLVYMFALVYSLLHIFTWASIRYRLPVDASMMPFAGLAINNAWKWMRVRIAPRSLNQDIQPQ